MRLNADGSLDDTFTTVVEGGAVVGMALDAAGRMVIGGEFTQVNGTNLARFARLNADGSLDGDVNLPANGYASALTIQPDGAILVGGALSELGGAA
ncbi:MAG: delta-60 repeat domain-containing protein [Caldilineaceae bacterium]